MCQTAPALLFLALHSHLPQTSTQKEYYMPEGVTDIQTRT